MKWNWWIHNGFYIGLSWMACCTTLHIWSSTVGLVSASTMMLTKRFINERILISIFYKAMHKQAWSDLHFFSLDLIYAKTSTSKISSYRIQNEGEIFRALDPGVLLLNRCTMPWELFPCSCWSKWGTRVTTVLCEYFLLSVDDHRESGELGETKKYVLFRR